MMSVVGRALASGDRHEQVRPPVVGLLGKRREGRQQTPQDAHQQGAQSGPHPPGTVPPHDAYLASVTRVRCDHGGSRPGPPRLEHRASPPPEVAGSSPVASRSGLQPASIPAATCARHHERCAGTGRHGCTPRPVAEQALGDRDPQLPDRLRRRGDHRNGRGHRARPQQPHHHRSRYSPSRSSSAMRSRPGRCCGPGSTLAAVIPIAVAADTVSITIMEAIDNAVVALVPGAIDAGIGDALFFLGPAPRRIRARLRTCVPRQPRRTSAGGRAAAPAPGSPSQRGSKLGCRARDERRRRDPHPRPVEGLWRRARALRPRPRGRARRDLRLPRPERRRQVDDDAAAARPDRADRGVGDGAGARQPRGEPRDPAPGRVPARRLRALSEAHRRGDARLPGRAARRRRPARARRAGGALRRAARPAGARALDGEPAEARADPGVHARARAADPRRADRRPRSAGPAELPRAARRGRRAGADGVPLLPHAVGGRAGRATGSRSCAAGGSSWSTRSRTCARSPSGGSRSSSRAAPRPSRSSARCRACGRPRSTARICVVAFEGSADPLVKALAAHEVRSIRSRDDDLEEIFLHYYREDGRSERADLQDGGASAMLATGLTALGMALGDRHGRARCFPAVGDSIGKLDLPEGVADAARRRRLRNDHRLDAERDRRRLRPARDRRDRRSPAPPAPPRARRRTGSSRWCWPTRSSARACSWPRPAAVAVSVVIVAVGTWLGLVAGVAVARRRHRARHLAALAVHLAFFGFATGALALALAGATGRKAVAAGGAAAFALARLPGQRVRAAGRRRSSG